MKEANMGVLATDLGTTKTSRSIVREPSLTEAKARLAHHY
jgi:hypothetical protein